MWTRGICLGCDKDSNPLIPIPTAEMGSMLLGYAQLQTANGEASGHYKLSVTFQFHPLYYFPPKLNPFQDLFTKFYTHVNTIPAVCIHG